jgi:hypothetical protein
MVQTMDLTLALHMPYHCTMRSDVLTCGIGYFLYNFYLMLMCNADMSTSSIQSSLVHLSRLVIYPVNFWPLV